MVVGEGGFVGYLGTNDALEVEKRAKLGDTKAINIQEALFYQVAKSTRLKAAPFLGEFDYGRRPRRSA